jgi:hypothetical protein
MVGTEREVIVSAALELLTDRAAYDRMAKVANPFGDGHASERIVRVLRNWPVAGASPDFARAAQATDAVRTDRIASFTGMDD